MSEFWQHIEALPDSGAIVIGGRRCGTPELRDLALRASADLSRRGVEPGDMVACLLPNSVEFVVLWWACAHRGARFHPVNAGLRGDTLSFILCAADPALVLAADDLVPVARAAVPEPDRVLAAGDWLGLLPPPATSAPAGPGGQVIFTSGTTGRPKGVVWPAVTQCGHTLAYALEMVVLDPTEAAYACLPLFHVTAQGTTMATLTHGGTIHLDNGFPVRTFWQRIAETGAVTFPFVGSILSVLLKDDRPAPAHRCRTVFGAASPDHAWEAMRERYGVALVETYGQTEMGGTWLMNLDGRPGSVGAPCERIEVRLAPVEGTSGESGELQVLPREPGYFMSGYLDPDETAAAMTPDGWYQTRDLLAVRSDGYYRFVGRTADAIRRRGENVSAWEVEQAFLAHPDVAEAAAVGVPSDLAEEEIALYYVRRPGSDLTSYDLRRWSAGRLGAFMRPRYYVALDALPKTQTQRVRKALLRERVLTGDDVVGIP
ncbi:MAG: AMP-binding protein [Geodermatophilaceae bacterium]|nr:AMP-binding protein [Geodermatophilaceae bacterium]